MFRLPVCPHCGTVYRYRDTKKAFRQKENTCYHCQQKFRAALMPYLAVEALILLPLCIGFNILLLTRMTQLNLIALFAATAGFLLLGFLLYPFFVHFRKIEKTAEKNQKNSQYSPIIVNNGSNNKKNQKKQQKSMKRRS